MKQGIVAVALLMMLLIGLSWIGSDPVHGAGYVVDDSADDEWAHDLSPGDYVCADSFGSCTLRAAIEEANAQGGPHTITFSETMTIYLDKAEGPLPSLVEPITIDASAVWNNAEDAPGVMIHGGGGSFAGLVPTAMGCEIYGLYITAFNSSGVYVTSNGNTIGGTGAGQRNVISGNNTGITLSGGVAHSNVVRNNYIGLTALGTTTNPNQTGILLTGGASNNIIGGDTGNQGNVIAGNTTNGVVLESSGTTNNRLSNNLIGVGVDFSTLPNGQYGVRIQNGPSDNSIGGADGWGNFISSNGSSGLFIGNAGSGMDVSWNVISGHTLDGISTYNTAGAQIHDNIIASNTLAGVRVSGASATWNLIWPNSITANGSKGIIVQDGANANIATPTIEHACQWGASGTACPACWVALYSDSDDEGQVYHDAVRADGSGKWSYTGGPLLGPNLTATAIDTLGNTSEFSAPAAVGTVCHWVYLPLIRNR